MNALAGHALVTGGGTGIGAAIARTLATAGVKVTLVGRRRKPLDAVADDIGAAVAVADATDPDQVAAAFVKASAANRPLTPLIDRESVVQGKCGSVCLRPGGRGIIYKQTQK